MEIMGQTPGAARAILAPPAPGWSEQGEYQAAPSLANDHNTKVPSPGPLQSADVEGRTDQPSRGVEKCLHCTDKLAAEPVCEETFAFGASEPFHNETRADLTLREISHLPWAENVDGSEPSLTAHSKLRAEQRGDSETVMTGRAEAGHPSLDGAKTLQYHTVSNGPPAPSEGGVFAMGDLAATAVQLAGDALGGQGTARMKTSWFGNTSPDRVGDTGAPVELVPSGTNPDDRDVPARARGERYWSPREQSGSGINVPETAELGVAGSQGGSNRLQVPEAVHDATGGLRPAAILAGTDSIARNGEGAAQVHASPELVAAENAAQPRNAPVRHIVWSNRWNAVPAAAMPGQVPQSMDVSPSPTIDLHALPLASSVPPESPLATATGAGDESIGLTSAASPAPWDVSEAIRTEYPTWSGLRPLAGGNQLEASYPLLEIADEAPMSPGVRGSAKEGVVPEGSSWTATSPGPRELPIGHVTTSPQGGTRESLRRNVGAGTERTPSAKAWPVLPVEGGTLAAVEVAVADGPRQAMESIARPSAWEGVWNAKSQRELRVSFAPNALTKGQAAESASDLLLESGQDLELDAVESQSMAVRDEVPFGRAMQPTSAASVTLPGVGIAQSLKQIGAQIGESARGNGANSIDVRLNPEELGRLKISFHSGDAGLLVTIVADRPETVELIRRNIAMLTQELKNLGYESLSVDIGSSGSDRPQHSRPEEHRAANGEAHNVILPKEAPQHAREMPGGLDLKM